MPLPPVFGISLVNAVVASCGAARRVAAPYGRHGLRRAGGHRGPPLRGNFGPGRCDGRRSLESACPSGTQQGRENAVGASPQTRPSPLAGRSPVHPVWEGLAPPAGFRNLFGQHWRLRPAERRAGLPRPTGGMVRGGRAGQETRPYGAISVLRDMATTAATKPRLSLQNQTEPRKCRRGESQTRPSPLAGRSLVHPVGEGLAPPAGFRNLFGQHWRFRPAGRRAGSSRHTDVMDHEGRAATEGRPYGTISVLGDAMAAAALKPSLSLRNQTGPPKTP